jgi:hypothetical protein
LRAVGGFDEEIVFPFGEDVAPGWRARRKGVIGDFAPDALVYHAVSYPGFRYWWRFAMVHGQWARLVRNFPEMRREMLWCGVFLGRRHAALIGAGVGAVTAATAWPPAAVLAIPYLGLVFPRRFQRRELVSSVATVAFDTAVVAGMLKGSVRERALVL